MKTVSFPGQTSIISIHQGTIHVFTNIPDTLTLGTVQLFTCTPNTFTLDGPELSSDYTISCHTGKFLLKDGSWYSLHKKLDDTINFIKNDFIKLQAEKNIYLDWTSQKDALARIRRESLKQSSFYNNLSLLRKSKVNSIHSKVVDECRVDECNSISVKKYGRRQTKQQKTRLKKKYANQDSDSPICHSSEEKEILLWLRDRIYLPSTSRQKYLILPQEVVAYPLRKHRKYRISVQETGQEEEPNLSLRNHTVTSSDSGYRQNQLQQAPPPTINLALNAHEQVLIQQIRSLANRDRHDRAPPPAEHLQYAEIAARRSSYVHWPRKFGQDPNTMANNGFFYTGRVDLVRCFQCGIGLKDWSESDEPLFVHIKNSQNCPFLLRLLGPELLAVYKVLLEAISAQPIDPRFSPAEGLTANPIGFVPQRPVDFDDANTTRKILDMIGSVCKLCYGDKFSTGIRVGRNKVMVAAHALPEMLGIDSTEFTRRYREDRSMFEDLKRDSVYALFYYHSAIEGAVKFFFDGRVHFCDGVTDVAVLSLVPREDQQMPEPFKYFSFEYRDFILVGHPNGQITQYERVKNIFNLDTVAKREIEKLRLWCWSDLGQNYSYDNPQTADSEHRLLFHSDMSNGCSGSPGLVLVDGKFVAVITVFLHKYPDLLYDTNVPQSVKDRVPDNYRISQGANMFSVFAHMHADNPELCQEIFHFFQD